MVTFTVNLKKKITDTGKTKYEKNDVVATNSVPKCCYQVYLKQVRRPQVVKFSFAFKSIYTIFIGKHKRKLYLL